jgi:hypothetical protein
MATKTVDDVDALLELLAGRKKGRTKDGLSVEEAAIPLRSITQHPLVQFRQKLSPATKAWLRDVAENGGELDPAVVVTCIITDVPAAVAPDAGPDTHVRGAGSTNDSRRLD